MLELLLVLVLFLVELLVLTRSCRYLVPFPYAWGLFETFRRGYLERVSSERGSIARLQESGEDARGAEKISGAMLQQDDSMADYCGDKGWNRYEILAVGNKIEVAVNGVKAFEYVSVLCVCCRLLLLTPPLVLGTSRRTSRLSCAAQSGCRSITCRSRGSSRGLAIGRRRCASATFWWSTGRNRRSLLACGTPSMIKVESTSKLYTITNQSD